MRRGNGEALYGERTRRALENFRISRLRVDHSLITAFAEIKKAAAEANMQLGTLEPGLGTVICQAADEIIAGRWADQFALDVFSAGEGASYNTNVNEVIASRTLELLGSSRAGDTHLHPIDYVNQSQSGNDVMPTAMRIAAWRQLRRLSKALAQLTDSFGIKAREFSEIVKPGRIHLREAAQITLGEEFGGYAGNLNRALARLQMAGEPLLEIPLGGGAVGAGEGAHPLYPHLVVTRLSQITGLDLRPATDRFQSQQSLGDFAALSAALRLYAIELNKVANDLRLLSSGPQEGLAEIELPSVELPSIELPSPEPSGMGESIPAMAEMINMVCFHISGHDLAIALSAEAGQLELNMTMPYVAYALLESLDLLCNAALTFEERCVRGITARPDRYGHLFDPM